MDLFNYSRRESTEVNVGATPLGGANVYFCRLTAGVIE